MRQLIIIVIIVIVLRVQIHKDFIDYVRVVFLEIDLVLLSFKESWVVTCSAEEV